MYSLRSRVGLAVVQLLLVVLMVSCLSRTLIYCYLPVNDGWRSTDTIRFHLDDIPSNDIYSFHAGVRYNDRYNYKDIWMVMEQRTGTTVRIDTLHIDLLTDAPELPERGVVMHEAEVLVRAYRLAAGQPLDVLIYPIMTDSLLEGITDVGLRVE